MAQLPWLNPKTNRIEMRDVNDPIFYSPLEESERYTLEQLDKEMAWIKEHGPEPHQDPGRVEGLVGGIEEFKQEERDYQNRLRGIAPRTDPDLPLGEAWQAVSYTPTAQQRQDQIREQAQRQSQRAQEARRERLFAEDQARETPAFPAAGFGTGQGRAPPGSYDPTSASWTQKPPLQQPWLGQVVSPDISPEAQAVYSRAATQLGETAERVQQILGKGWEEKLDPAVASRKLLRYAEARAGGAEHLVTRWKGDVAPITAMQTTVAGHILAAQGTPAGFGEGRTPLEKAPPRQLHTGSRFAPLDVVATAIPGIARTPEGRYEMGTLPSKVAKMPNLALQQYQLFYSGLGAPREAAVRAAGAPMADIGQPVSIFFTGSRTTPEGAGQADPSIGAATRMMVRNVPYTGEEPEGLIQVGQQWKRGEDIVPYTGAAKLNVGEQYEQWTLMQIGRYTKRDPTTGDQPGQEQQMYAMQFEARMPESALTSMKDIGVKAGQYILSGTEERWGTKLLVSDIRNIWAVGAGIAAMGKQAQQEIWGRTFAIYGVKEGREFQEWAVSQVARHEARTPQVFQRDDPIVQAKLKAGLLREVSGAKSPEGTFLAYETAIGFKAEALARWTQGWTWGKQTLGVESTAQIAKGQQAFVAAMGQIGRRGYEAATGIGKAYFASQGLGEQPSVSVEEIAKSGMGSLRATVAERLEEQQIDPGSSEYRRRYKAELLRAVGERFPGKGIEFGEGVVTAAPEDVLRYEGWVPGAKSLGAMATTMGQALESRLETRAGVYRTREQVEAGEEPVRSAQVQATVEAEQASQEQVMMAQLGEVTESGTFRSKLMGTHMEGGRAGGQVVPADIPAERFVGGASVLGRMLQTSGMSGDERADLVNQMMRGQIPGPEILSRRYPVLTEEQSNIVLAYMSPKEWVERGYGTVQQYKEQYGAVIGMSRTVAQAGGGDFDVDPYEALQGVLYETNKETGDVRVTRLLTGERITGDELRVIAERHGAREVQSEVEKVFAGSTVEKVQEQWRKMATSLSPEEFGEISLGRQVQKAGAGAMTNLFGRQLRERMLTEDEPTKEAAGRFGTLALTAVDVKEQSEALQTIMNLYTTGNVTTGGFYKRGEGEPGFVGGFTPTAFFGYSVRQVMGLKEVPVAARARGLFDPESAARAFPGSTEEQRTQSLRQIEQGIKAGDVGAVLRTLEEYATGVEEMSKISPLPGILQEQSSRRAAAKAGKVQETASGGARLTIATEELKRAAAEGEALQQFTKAIGSGQKTGLGPAMVALLNSQSSEYQAIAKDTLKRLGITEAELRGLLAQQETEATVPAEQKTPKTAVDEAVAAEPVVPTATTGGTGARVPTGPVVQTAPPPDDDDMPLARQWQAEQQAKQAAAAQRTPSAKAVPQPTQVITGQVAPAGVPGGQAAVPDIQTAATVVQALAGGGGNWVMGMKEGEVWFKPGEQIPGWGKDTETRLGQLNQQLTRAAEILEPATTSGQPPSKQQVALARSLKPVIKELRLLGQSATMGGSVSNAVAASATASLIEGISEGVLQLGATETLEDRMEAAVPAVTARGGAWLKQATTQQLEGLPGVGPVIAARIQQRVAAGGGRMGERDFAGVKGLGAVTAAPIVPAVEKEAAWWSAGGEERVEDLYQSLDATLRVGMDELTLERINAPLGTFASNVAALEKAGIEVPTKYTDLIERVRAQAHEFGKESAALRARDPRWKEQRAARIRDRAAIEAREKWQAPARRAELPFAPGRLGAEEWQVREAWSAGTPAAIQQAVVWGEGTQGQMEQMFQQLMGAGLADPAVMRDQGAAYAPMIRQYQQGMRRAQQAGVSLPPAMEQLSTVLGQAQIGGQAAATLEMQPIIQEDIQRGQAANLEQLKLATEGLKSFTTVVGDASKTVEEGNQLTRRQQQQVGAAGALARTVIGAVGQMPEGVGPGQAGAPENVAARRQAEDIRSQIGQMAISQQAQLGIPPTFGQRAGGAIRGMLLGRQGLLSGWGLMRMRRLWGMTGGAAMRQIPRAAQAEQAAYGAAYATQPLGQYQYGGMAMNYVSQQAQRENYQLAVGRGAAGAWGWAQGGLGQDVGTAMGIAGPAVGAGLMAGSLAMAIPGIGAGLAFGGIGLPIAAAGTMLGGALYSRQAMQDPERMALAAALGPRDRQGRGEVAQLGRRLGYVGEQIGQGDVTGAFDYILSQVGQGVTGQYFRGELALGGPEGLPGRAQAAVGRWLGVGDAEQQRGLVGRGQEIISGDVTQMDPAQAAASIQYYAQQATGRRGPLRFMSETAAIQQGQQWLQYGWGENIEDIFNDPQFAQMGVLGLQAAQMEEMGRGWGLPVGQGQRMRNIWMDLPQGAAREQFARNQGVMQPLGRFGLQPEQVAGMGNLGLQGERMAQGLAAGSGFAWSALGQEFGRENLMTVNPQTGFGIGVNWGGNILQGNLGQAGAAGRAVNVQGGQITFNVTGQTVGFNQWDIQDYAIAQRRGAEDEQAAFRRGGWEQAGQYVLGGGLFGRGTRAIGAEMRGEQYEYQMEQFGFQRRNLALADRQFMERWGRGREQTEAAEGWWQEDWQERGRRQGITFGWRMEDIEFKGQQAGLQFGWQMEDLAEAERFATGRGRRGIRRQRERAAISYGMGMGQLEEEESRLKERREWEEADHAREKDRHDTRSEWQRDELEMQLRHHQQRMALSEDRLSASEDYFDTMHVLQEEQRELSETYWGVQHERQGQSLDMAEDYRDIQREIEDAQLALGKAQQIQVNRFRAEFESGSLLDQAWKGFWNRAIDWLEEQSDDLYIVLNKQKAAYLQ